MRADAQRNRDKLLDAARDVFREQGYDASLDLVAKRAGVGAGTLYRHFPSREDLVDALMHRWVSRVTEEAEKALAHEGPPRAVLLDWLTRYVSLISLHKGGAAKITSAMAQPTSPMRNKCTALLDASDQVLERLRAEGVLRDGVDALQVARLAGGVASVADQSDLEASLVAPMLEVVADGLLAHR